METSHGTHSATLRCGGGVYLPAKEVGHQMDSNKTTPSSYESPRVTVVGTLSELTLQGKTFSPTNDFTYPTIVTSTFGPLNFS